MTVYMNIWYLGQVPDGGKYLVQHPVLYSVDRWTACHASQNTGRSHSRC